MLKINKTQEPKYFTQAKSVIKNKNTAEAWQEKPISAIRERLRADILADQNSLCAYCEQYITSNKQEANIDHFVKRSLNQSLTLAYDNLLVSCNSDNRCSKNKDKNIKSHAENLRLVNPVSDDPYEYFDYLAAGDIVAKTPNGKVTLDKANFTIETFQLNQTVLLERRRADGVRIIAWLKKDCTLSQQELSDLIRTAFPDFISFQKALIERITGAGRTSKERVSRCSPPEPAVDPDDWVTPEDQSGGRKLAGCPVGRPYREASGSGER